MKVIRGIKLNNAECFLHCRISSGLQCHKILLKGYKTILDNSVNFVPIIMLIL